MWHCSLAHYKELLSPSVSQLMCVHSFVILDMLSCRASADKNKKRDSPPGSSVHGISQATILGCHFLLQGIFPTQGSNPYLLCLLHWYVDSLPLSHLGSPIPSTCVWCSVISPVQLFATSWTVAHQTPLSMRLPRQEYWSELLFPTPEDLPSPGIELGSLAAPVLAGRFFTTVPPRNRY